MADLDPFAASGFAPVQAPPAVVAQPDALDPFSASGFRPSAEQPVAATPAAPSVPISQLMPRVIGNPGNPLPLGLVFNNEQMNREAQASAPRVLEKVGEGATLGLLPYGIAAARRLGGVPFSQGLQEARNYTAETDKQNPRLSGLLEGIGGVAPAVMTYGAAEPAFAAARSALPNIPYLTPMAKALLSPVAARIAAGTGLGAATAAGHDVGSGQTENLSSDALKGAAIGGGLQATGEAAGPFFQAVSNGAQSLYAGGKNVFTNAGKQGVVGQVLRESGSGFPNQAARSPVPGLTLRVPQATGNPGLASLESALASEPGMQTGNLGDFVTNNRTPNQASALARAMVGSDAGIEPAVLANQASSRGVQAIQNVDKGLGEVERSLWNAPALKSVQLNGPSLASGVAQDVATLPASWRDAVTGPQNRLGSYLRELNELGPNASIADINSVRSRLLGVARDAASGPQPDSVTAAAAGRMANSILDRMGADPAILGTPASAVAPVTEMHMIPGETQAVPVQIGGRSTPAVAGNQTALPAYQAARDFTRQYNQAKGFNEFSGILHPNAQGNMQGNAERQFGQFFDTSGGTSSGLQRLQGLSNFARQAGLDQHANELENATRQYLGAAVLKQARAGNGLNAIGEPQINFATLASTANKLAPALNATPMTAPIAGDIQAAGNAAELLNRPSTMRGITGSHTFELLKRNDLVNAILGQSATSGLGGLAGGYAGYEYGPEDVPAYIRVPVGAMAGAMLGGRAGPAFGSVISHTPVLRNIGAGTSEGIRRQILEALSNMPAYERALAAPMLTGPALSQSGMLTNAARTAAELGIVPATGRTGQ